jgi:hypothetical protein
MQRVSAGVLVDAHPEPLRRCAQPVREPGRVDEAGAGAVPDAAAVGGGEDFGLHRGRVEDLDVVAEAPQQLDLLLDPRVLVGLEERDEVAGELEVAVDAVRSRSACIPAKLSPPRRSSAGTRPRSAPAR